MNKWFDELQLMGILSCTERCGSVIGFMKMRFLSPTFVTYKLVIEIFVRNYIIPQMELISRQRMAMKLIM